MSNDSWGLRFSRFIGPGSFDLRIAVPLLFTSAILQVLLSPELQNPEGLYVVALVSLIVHVAMFFALVLIGHFLKPRLSRGDVGFLWVLGIGAALGVLRTAVGWATYQTVGSFLELPFPAPVRPLANISSSILIVLPLMILGSARDRFIQSRQQLLALNVLKTADSNVVPEEVIEFVDKTRVQMSQLPKEVTWRDFRNLLRKIIASDLRPLSHRLWEIEDKRLNSFSIRVIFQNALNNHFFKPQIVVPIWFLTSAPVNINEFGLESGIEISLIRTALLLLVLVIARQIRTTSSALQFGKLVLTVLTVTVLQTLVGRGVLEPEDQDIQLRFVLAALVWITQLIILVGMSWSLFESGAQVRSQLTRVNGEPHAKSATTNGAEFLRGRKLARHLHGQVQNQLHALIDGVESDEKVMDGSIFSKIELILQSAIEPFEDAITSQEGLEASLLAQWGGLIEIDYEFLPSKVVLTKEVWMLVSSVAEEGVANAVRHGFASMVKVSVVLSDADVIVSIRDNGTGPREGYPGMGTAFFSSISNDWVLRDTGSGSKLRLVLKNLEN